MIKTIAGPFNNRQDAEDTAKQIGKNCSVFGKHKTDQEGFCLDECDWYIEQDDSIPSGKLFGYDMDYFMAKQYK